MKLFQTLTSKKDHITDKTLLKLSVVQVMRVWKGSAETSARFRFVKIEAQLPQLTTVHAPDTHHMNM